MRRFYRKGSFWATLSTLLLALTIAVGGVLPNPTFWIVLAPALVAVTLWAIFQQHPKRQFIWTSVAIGLTALLTFFIHRGIGIGAIAGLGSFFWIRWNLTESRMEAEIQDLKTPEDKVRERIGVLHQRIQAYTEKIQAYEDQLLMSDRYLAKVREQLSDPSLSASNRWTSENLQASLQCSIDNRKLLIKFFSEVKARYQREITNMKHRMDNLEIMEFLEEQDEFQEAADLEHAILDAGLQDELDKIELELPTLIYGIEEHAVDLTEDMKKRLEETIDRLQEF